MDIFPDSVGTELALLGLAFVLSVAIGIERQIRQKSAGIRTHVLVGLGSATFTLVSAFGFQMVAGPAVTYDPSRVAAQVVTGVGFLGAGLIFLRRNVVRGLTTAATVWVVAAVGMACGAGMPVLAVAVTALHLITMTLISPLARRLPSGDRKRVVSVLYREGEGVLRTLLKTASDMGFAAAVLSTKALPGEPHRVAVRLRFIGRTPLSDLVLAITEIPGVLEVQGSDDRTATAPFSPPASLHSLASASRLARSSSGCNGDSVTQLRISWPARISASTSSTSSVASLSKMRCFRPERSMYDLKASAVVANPPGTETPRRERWPIISPSDEFFPPTLGRSDRRSSSSHSTSSDMGTPGAVWMRSFA